ncbi:MAG: DUF6596 domain-containing protein [Myxococcota bacterium]
MDDAHRAVEHAARDGYGRLVAWIATRCGDVELAEDAVADALEAALRSWPESGVPRNPEAWLLTAARRKMIDRGRRGQTRRDAAQRLRMEAEEAAEVPFRTSLPDRRAELLFVCAHPSVPRAMRTPLMLQLVLGLDAARIGSAMLVKPATMGQRLVRAKRRIADENLRFEVPEPSALAERLPPVLDAIYAAYGTGWDDEPGGRSTGLAAEAIWLARTLVARLPRAAEALGLYGLMLHCEARRSARRAPGGRFVPLDEQDPAAWDGTLLEEAEKALYLAARERTPGPYQLEATIQSIHADRRRTGKVDGRALHEAYGVLVAKYPTLGAWIGRAASFGRLGRPAEGLALLDRLEADAVQRHQPYWAVRAHLARLQRREDEAQAAYERAMGLTEDPAVRRWLDARRRAGPAQ